jgi:hypothetical protein
MNKYTSLETDIFSIFASATWVLENIDTYPENFTQRENTSEFIRVGIVTKAPQNLNSVSGVLLIDIFIGAGSGPNKAYLIADKLDTYLAGKTIITTANGNTQLFSSTLAPIGIDAVNKSLQRYQYTIPFNYFGV